MQKLESQQTQQATNLATKTQNSLDEFRHYASLDAISHDDNQTPISADDYPIHCNQSGAFIRNFDMQTEIAPLVEIHGIAKARDILAYLATSHTMPHWLYQTPDTIPNASIMYPREHVIFAFSRIYYDGKQEHEFHNDRCAAFKLLQKCNYDLIRALNSALIAYLADVNVGRYPSVPAFALNMQKACTDESIAKFILWLNFECKKVREKDNKLVLSESYQNYVARGTGIYKTCRVATKKKLTKNANDFFDELDLGDMQHAFGCKTGKRVTADSPLQMVASDATVQRFENKGNASGGKVLFSKRNDVTKTPSIATIKL